jgi:hypothetical protein
MALPCGTTGSLLPRFLTVKRPYANTLFARLPSVLRAPLEASVTLLEATTPVKLPTTHCSRLRRVRHRINKGWYFNVDSTMPSDTASKSPTYPTHHLPNVNVKL